MAQALFYSSNAVAMTLAAGIASGDTTCNLSSTSGLPASFPFKLLIGWQTAQQEVVHCTALSGVVATISRGQDGTTAQAHSIGASVVHGVSAREFNDLESHVGASSAVHGITGSVVGTTDTQTITNKTLDTASGNVLKVNGNTLAATAGSATVSVPNSTDTLVGKNTTDTLTNKTLTTPTVTAPTVKPSVNSGVALTVTGLASQSGDLQEWTDSTPTVLAKVYSNGTWQGPQIFVIGQGAVGNIVALVKGSSGQTASLQEWQNNSGTPLAKIDQSGNLAATNVTSAWTAYTPTFTNITSPAGTFAYLQMGKTLFVRGVFTGGTVTASAAITLTLPNSLSGVAGVTQHVPAATGTTSQPWVVNGALTPTKISSIALTAGASLNHFFNCAVEVA